jgi:hypothetical protein
VVAVVLLALPVGAWAGRAQTAECPRELCAGVAPDGSRVVFPFGEELMSGAGRSQVYEWSRGRLRMVIPVPAGVSASIPGSYRGESADLQHLFVETGLALSPEDVDGGAYDVYDFSGGTASLVSTGPLDRDAKSRAELLGLSADGTTVVFASPEALTRRDGDRSRDIYRWHNGPRAPRTTLLSGETIAPRMRILPRARLLASGAIKVGLACPKVETHGPCAGKVRLTLGRAGKTIGSAPFHIAAGHRRRVDVDLKRGPGARAPLFVHVLGADQVGNHSTTVLRVRMGLSGTLGSPSPYVS